MKTKYIYTFATTLLFCITCSYVSAQLTSADRKRLQPYIHNGKYNQATVSRGKAIEFRMTFYKGLNYRLLLLSEDLQKIQFSVSDTTNNVYFDNKSNNYNTTWDFNVGSSQELIIKVYIPEGEPKRKGNVALIVGFKES